MFALGAALVCGLLAAPALAASPAVDYALNCQGCHLDDGAGTPGSVPPLAGSVGRFMRIRGGREYLVQVPGVATAPLDDAALAAVLNWMLDRFGPPQLPEKYEAYTAAEVGALRQKPLTNVDRVRAELLRDVDRR
jgi:hypothetical protein